MLFYKLTDSPPSVPLEYSGVDCTNHCQYCFAKGYSCRESDYQKFQKLIRHLDKRKNLAAELFKTGKPVLLSNRSDPFCEANRRETSSVLKLLRQFPNGIYFQTKTGDGMEEALEIMGEKQNVAWYITVTCADDELSKKLEPNAMWMPPMVDPRINPDPAMPTQMHESE
jgi:DNA repair photolyase